MLLRQSFFVLTAVFALAGIATEVHADQRIALVIGNSDYRNVSRLPNPTNDAEAIGALFRKAGFDVVNLRRDLDVSEMRRTIGDFADAARNADVAVVYYAGHGMEVNGVNYLIPVDAKLQRDFDVEDEAISLDRVLRVLEPAKRLRLVILDACRDNPFARSMKRTVPTRAVGRGLAPVEPSTDTLVAYAAKAGSVASDGIGANSPYTQALLKHLLEPGLDVTIALRRVRDEVMRVTSNRQEPYFYGSLGGTLASLVSGGSDFAPGPSTSSDAAQAWTVAERSTDPAVLEAFIKYYGDTFYGTMARSRLAELKRQQVAVAEPPKTPPTQTMPAQPPPFPGGKAVEMTVMFGAGSAADATARYLAEGMAKQLNVPVLVENRTGGGGAIGYTYVQKQRPDGYSIIWHSNAISVTYHSGALPFDYKAFDAVARVSLETPVIAVRSDSPWKSLRELIDYAKSNPGKLRIGNSGIGSHTHFSASALFTIGGGSVVHVPFTDGQAVANLVGGRIEGIVQLTAALVGQVKSGDLRVLAVLGSRRDPTFPDVPTASELGYAASLDLWRGDAAPKGTPRPVIAKLQDAMKRTVESQAFIDAGKAIGFTPAYLGADDFGRLIANDDAKLAQVMANLGLRRASGR